MTARKPCSDEKIQNQNTTIKKNLPITADKNLSAKKRGGKHTELLLLSSGKSLPRGCGGTPRLPPSALTGIFSPMTEQQKPRILITEKSKKLRGSRRKRQALSKGRKREFKKKKKTQKNGHKNATKPALTINRFEGNAASNKAMTAWEKKVRGVGNGSKKNSQGQSFRSPHKGIERCGKAQFNQGPLNLPRLKEKGFGRIRRKEKSPTRVAKSQQERTLP